MVKRIGWFLLFLEGLLALKLISLGLGLVNLPSDAAVFFGLCLVGGTFILTPSIMMKTWKTLIAPSHDKETKNEA